MSLFKQMPITSPPIQKSVLNSPTIQLDIDQVKLFQQYQQQQQQQQHEHLQMQLQQQQQQQQTTSIASTPTKEFIDPMSFVQQGGQLTDTNTQQQLIALQSQQQQQQQAKVQPLANLEQELAKIHNNKPVQQSLQIVTNPMGSPQISQNTLVIDSLTYSDALKLPPDATPINSNQSHIDTMSIATGIAGGIMTVAAAAAATVPINVIDSQPVAQNVRKISRFQVSIVDPNMTASADKATAMVSNVVPSLPANVTGSFTQPNESQIINSMNMNTNAANVNFTQLQTNFQPNQATAVYHHAERTEQAQAQQQHLLFQQPRLVNIHVALKIFM